MAVNTIAYGFLGLEHLATERVTTVGTDIIIDAITQSAAEYTRAVNALMAALVARTVTVQEQYRLPGTGTLQPLDEFGIPLTVREGGHYTIAFPLEGGGTAWGTNRVTRALMTVQEANVYTVEALKRDQDWLRRHLLASLFDNVAWAFDDPLLGSVTVEPLANTDAVTYVKTGGAAATDEHYLFQAAAIADATDPYDDIYTELMEHPSNSGPVVCYIATSLVATTKALSAFIPVTDPDVQIGSATDQLGSIIDRGLGDLVLGKVDNCWIIEWRNMPAGYILAHAQGAGPVVAMREYDAPELQGFFPENHSPDGNLQETRMIRYAGFGVRNRIGAAVCFVGGGSYAIPSGYAAPLAV